MVLIQVYVKKLKDKNVQSKIKTQIEKKAFEELKLSIKEDEYFFFLLKFLRLTSINFRNPDEFLNLFVFNKAGLKEYCFS